MAHGKWFRAVLNTAQEAGKLHLREIKEETGLVPDRFYSANTIEAFYEVNQNCINLIPVFVGFIDTEYEVRLRAQRVSMDYGRRGG